MLKTQFLNNSSQLLLSFKAISKNGYAQIVQDFMSPNCVNKVLSYPHINFYFTEVLNMNSQSDLFCSETSSVEKVGYAEA
ncbi:MAG: hypothetical protein WCH01_08755 [Methylococcaceae bacterium]